MSKLAGALPSARPRVSQGTVAGVPDKFYPKTL